MSQEERYGTRDRTYSAWHRRGNIARFLGVEAAQQLSMIDLDAVEYDNTTNEPIAFIETALDVGQTHKAYTVMKNIARLCSPIIPAFIVLYKKSGSMNPADSDVEDVQSFRVKRVHPTVDKNWTVMTPQQWAEYLVTIRTYRLAPLKDVIDWTEKIGCSNE